MEGKPFLIHQFKKVSRFYMEEFRTTIKFLVEGQNQTGVAHYCNAKRCCKFHVPKKRQPQTVRTEARNSSEIIVEKL